jgi:hypothetical protein
MVAMTLEGEIEALNTRLRQLKSQFNLFFSGALPKPPLEVRDLLDKDVKRLGMIREMKLSQRFLYNNFVNRWNLYSELWNKKLQEREEGARTIVMARRRLGIDAAPGSEQLPAQAAPAPSKRLVARAAIRNAVDDSGADLKAFYKSFLEAKQEAGGGKAPSFERFCQEIERQVKTIREKTSCEKVDFRLYLEDNKVSLRAKPVRKSAEGNDLSDLEERT